MGPVAFAFGGFGEFTVWDGDDESLCTSVVHSPALVLSTDGVKTSCAVTECFAL